MTPQERHAESRRRAIQEQQARDRAAYEQSERAAAAAQRARSVQAAQITARSEAAETAASARASGGGLANALGKIAGVADQSEAGVKLNELRRAVVLGELLGPPVSTRPPS